MRLPTVRGVTAVLGVFALSATLAACGDDDPGADPPASPSSDTASVAADPVTLTFGAYGTGPEVRAYKKVVSSYDESHDAVDVSVKTWSSEGRMLRDLRSGEHVPDVFLTPRADLDSLVEEKLVRPVDTYLDARGVEFGEDYSRQALEDFSSDRRLQCMPYAADPTLIYYNTDLIDLTAVHDDDVDPPEVDAGTWDLDQFELALQQVSSEHPNAAGVYVDSSLSGISPWIEAAGGHVFDDPLAPKTTTLTDEDSLEALGRLLPIINDPKYRLTDAERAGDSALTWFTKGKLAVMAGERDLVPRLRKERGLHWDVISMPADGSDATTGDYTGLCLSQEGKHDQAAADLLAHLVTDDAVARVARGGYIVPANQAVSYSPAFEAERRRPHTSIAFVLAIRNMRVMPNAPTTKNLDRVTRADVRTLLGPAWETHVDQAAESIDDATEEVLTPEETSPGPSDSSTGG